MSLVAPALLLGLLLASGLIMTIFRLPFMRATTFTQRISPQLRTVDTSSRLLRTPSENLTPFGPLERILAPPLRDIARSLERMNLSAAAVTRRLERAGLRRSAVDFRAAQLMWSAGAFLAVLIIGILGAVLGSVTVPLVLAAALSAGIAGYLGTEYWLTRRIARRQELILNEFPSLAEMLALAVGAGASTRTALERVARVARGELAEEFQLALADTRAGVPLIEALHRLAARVQLAPVERFVDGLAVAVERGTPLGDVLRAQAQDVRDVAKRQLMETAGKREIAMMVPTVFGLLPLTVLFAVFPGIAAISISL